MTLATWIHFAAARLSRAGVQSPQLESQLLAAHVIGADRTWIVAHPEAGIHELAGESLLQRREGGEPLAYILGRREFFGRQFSVRTGVLIPRQETEMLVELAPKFLASPFPAVLDVGTGSGCIAISLKLEHPQWRVSALDLSAAALEVAAENGVQLQADVEWIHSDLFAGVEGRSFDLVVTNPPYVEREAALPLEVAQWEPASALFAPGDTFSLYRRLALEARSVLKDGGALLTEIGAGQASDVCEIFESSGWTAAGTFNDLAGIERVLGFTK